MKEELRAAAERAFEHGDYYWSVHVTDNNEYVYLRDYCLNGTDTDLDIVDQHVWFILLAAEFGL